MRRLRTVLTCALLAVPLLATHDSAAGAPTDRHDLSPPVGPMSDAPAADRGGALSPVLSPANLTYANASQGFLTDGAWMLQFGLARIDGSGYPTVVTMRGHDDILCKTQGWHFFAYGGGSSWSHSEFPVDYGYGGYSAGLAEGNNWLFGSGSHHTNGNGNFHIIGAGGGDYSNGLATPEAMYWGYGPAFGDFDSNGVVDVVANANPWSGSNTTSSTFVWRGPAGKWSLDQIIDKQYNVHFGIKFTDFDRDGFLDMAVSNDILREPGHFIWRYNSETSRFEPWANDLDEAMRSEPFDVGDVNGDGLPDVVMVHSYKQGQGWAQDLEAYVQTSPGRFSPSSNGLPKATEVAHLRLFDMDGDGDLDIAATETIPQGQWYTSRLAVWLNGGDATWTRAPVNIQGRILAPADWLEVDDIDNNGLGDFVFPENWGDCSEGGGFRAYKESTPVSVPKVWVDEPWGGERWYPDSIRYLRWRSAYPGSGCGGSTTLDYSTSGPSGPWKKLDDNLACAGVYAWKVPKDPSQNVFVRASVRSPKGPAEGLSGRGTVPFEIIGGSAVPLRAAVAAPAGGEVWQVAGQQRIEWTVSGGQAPYVSDVDYSTAGPAGPWKPVAAGVSSTSHLWTVPDDPSATAHVRVTVKDASSPQQSAAAVSRQFAIDRPLVPLTASLRADPTTIGSGGLSTLVLELKDPSGAGVDGATVAMTSDNGGSFGVVAGRGGGSYETTFTAPTVTAKATIGLTANASKPGHIESSSSASLEVSPFLPDLRVEPGSLRMDGDAIAGSALVLKAVVSNAGLSPAGESRISFLMDGEEFASETVSGMAVLETRDLARDWVAIKGNHELRIVLDADARIAESDETNNLASVKVDVRPSPRSWEFPWWLILLMAAVVAGVVAVAIAASRRRKRCRWCGARHAPSAPCGPVQEGARW